MADYDIWEPKRRIERSYNNSLKSVNKRIASAIGDIDDPYEIVRILKKLSNQKPFKDFSESLAMKMVTNIFNDTGKTWRQAARINSSSKEIYKAIMEELKNPKIRLAVAEQINNNTKLISTLPDEIAKYCTKYIKEESMKGKRASDIAKELSKLIDEKGMANISLIARTETSKTSTALTKARAESLGLDWYIWRTSKDARVRKSHMHMENVLIKWSNPPSPESLIGKTSVGYYHAGNIYNCRCYPEPVVDIEFISFPHRVYYNNQITLMTKQEFLKIA